MGRHRWNQDYRQFGDIWIKYDEMMNKIGDPDPETGCQYQLYGGTHKQGYMMVAALSIDPAGDRLDLHGNRIKSIMTTGHRVLARIHHNCNLQKKDLVYHTCLNMRCLNPAHIEIGTYTSLQQAFKTLGKTRGYVAGTPRKIQIQKRAYRFSIPELLQMKYATSKQEIIDNLNLTKLEASNIVRYFKSGVYAWLDEYDPKVTKTPKEIVDIKKK